MFHQQLLYIFFFFVFLHTDRWIFDTIIYSNTSTRLINVTWFDTTFVVKKRCYPSLRGIFFAVNKYDIWYIITGRIETEMMSGWTRLPHRTTSVWTVFIEKLHRSCFAERLYAVPTSRIYVAFTRVCSEIVLRINLTRIDCSRLLIFHRISVIFFPQMYNKRMRIIKPCNISDIHLRLLRW